MDNKISDIIRASLENAKDMVGANTVIGEAIPAGNGTVIIPVSKVTVGIASGGLDYKGKNGKETDKENNFGGGGGTGLSVAPVGFLVVRADGSVDLLNVDNPTTGGEGGGDAIASFIRRSPEIISRIKDIFTKKDDEEYDDVYDPEEDTEEL